MRKKSDLEIWLDKYYEEFEQNYPLEITGRVIASEYIKAIKECIKSGKPAKAPTHDEGDDY